MTPWVEAAADLQRGDELGVFHLGSTVIVIAKVPMEPAVSPGDRVRVGQVLASRLQRRSGRSA